MSLVRPKKICAWWVCKRKWWTALHGAWEGECWYIVLLKSLMFVWQVLSSPCCFSSGGLSVSHPNESPVSKIAVLQSRSAIGCILMCQAGRSDLNLDVIFTYVVHLCILAGLWLGGENRSQFHATQALTGVMNLLHEVETLTKTLKRFHFVFWKKMGATQPHPGRCCGGTLVWSPWLLLKSLAGLLCAIWRDGNVLHHWAGLGQMPEYIGDFSLVEDPVWQLCENLQAV